MASDAKKVNTDLQEVLEQQVYILREVEKENYQEVDVLLQDY
jgi:hypothetical protein